VENLQTVRRLKRELGSTGSMRSLELTDEV